MPTGTCARVDLSAAMHFLCFLVHNTCSKFSTLVVYCRLLKADPSLTQSYISLLSISLRGSRLRLDDVILCFCLRSWSGSCILGVNEASISIDVYVFAGILKCDGKDVVKKGHRKNKYLFTFPGLVAPVAGGKFGDLSQLDSRNPILYIDFPQASGASSFCRLLDENIFLSVSVAYQLMLGRDGWSYSAPLSIPKTSTSRWTLFEELGAYNVKIFLKVWYTILSTLYSCRYCCVGWLVTLFFHRLSFMRVAGIAGFLKLGWVC